MRIQQFILRIDEGGVGPLLRSFLARRAGRLPLDDDFAADATNANPLLTVDTADPWHA